MKTRRSVLRLSAPALVLTLALGFCSASAQATSPNGPYGILLNQWLDNTNVTSALLGVLKFDGAGNITGTYTLIGGGPDYALLTGAWTGTYSGKPDGSNTINLAFDFGGTITAAVAVTDGGTGLQLLVTGGSAPKPGQVITGTGRIQSAQGTMPAGSYGLLLNRWPDAQHNAQGVFGVFNLDGAGNATGSLTAVGPNLGLSATFTGTYSINPDSTGSITVSADIGITTTYAIVVTDGGSGILMLETSTNGGGGVFSGTARMQ
jgi:hypothetical protein